jgi:type IV pilus assembly protein PilM
MASSRVLAIDSGAGHVACGSFTAAKNGRLSLEHFALDSFNPDPALEPDWNKFIAQSLGSALKREKLGGTAAVTLPGHLTLTKFNKTPSVDKSKREKIIQFEAQQNIPYPLDEVAWDYFAVADDGLDLEVMLAAAKLDVAEGLCSAVTEAGATATTISPSVFALYRAFKYNYPEACGSALVLNIGARSTHLLFFDKQRFFARTIVLAGNSVTQTIADEIKQDFAHSEALKLQVLGGQSELADTSPARLAVLNAAQSFVGRLHLEITRSTVNYRRQSGAEQPACVYLTGGGSLVPELAASLAEKLKLPVERFDPLRNVDVGSKASEARERSAVIADLVGLAVQLVESQPPLNLLPASIRQVLAFRKEQPFYVGAAALLVLALGIPAYSFHNAAEAIKAKDAELRREIAPLQQIKDINTANLAQMEAAQKQIAAIHGIAESKSNWINFLTDLQDRLVNVEDVWLDSLQIRRDAGESASGEAVSSSGAAAPVLKLTLSGRLLDKEHPTDKVSPKSLERVNKLITSFTESRFIKGKEKETFDASEPGILKFNFVLEVKADHPL